MSIYPTMRPEITLDFANSRKLDPRITFSRSSTATYVEGGVIKYADEHQARFEEEGLLVEEARTNNTLYSTYEASNYEITNVTSTTNQLAPDGTSTAVLLTENTATGNHQIRNKSVQTTTNGTAFTWSVFVKPNGRTKFQFFTGYTQTTVFDVTAGTVSPAGSGTITAYTNGWYRLISTSTAIATGNIYQYLQLKNDSNLNNYAGDGTSGAYVWGWQSENSVPFATSYIPTAGSTVTRAADIAQITNVNFSSWYNQSEGTLAITAKTYDNNYTPLPLAFIHQDGSNSYQFNYQSQTTYLPRVSAGNYVITVDSSANSRDNCKIAGVYGPNSSGDFTAAVGVNGSSFERASPLVPNVIAATSLKIGSNHGNTLYANTTISRLSYYSRRLTDSELQTLTL